MEKNLKKARKRIKVGANGRSPLLLAIFLLLAIPTLAWSAEQRVTTLLQQLIQTNTVNPPGNEIEAVELLLEYFSDPIFETRVIETESGRGNLIVRLRGTGERDPLILLGHLDVVAADPIEWEVPPFSGQIKDGFVWGRGAIDMKGMVAMEVETMLRIAEAVGANSRSPLKGDLLFIGVADEETGGRLGAEALIEQVPELKKVGAVINEGAIGIKKKDMDLLPIQVAEKGVCWLKLTATGISGHGSMPHPENAALRLSRAMKTIGEYVFPFEETEIMVDFLESLSKDRGFLESFIMTNLFTPTLHYLTQPLARPRISQDKTLLAMLSHTAAPTMLESGTKINIIPNQAIGHVDARILPGMSPEKFRDFLQDLVGDDANLEIVVSSLPNESPRNSALYRTIKKSMAEHYPKAVTLPIISTGATDSRFFRAHNIPSYGLVPVIIPESDLASFHGKNERIPVEGLNKGVAVLKDIVEAYLGRATE